MPPGLDGQLLLLVEAAGLLGGEEAQEVEVVGQFLEGELLHGVLGALLVEVVEAEGLEVAGHEPTGTLGVRQVLGVPGRLLVGGLEPAVAGLGLIEVDAHGLLLAQEVVVAHEHVDAASAHLALEVDKRGHGTRRNPEDVHEQILPELGGVLLLVVFALGDSI